MWDISSIIDNISRLVGAAQASRELSSIPGDFGGNIPSHHAPAAAATMPNLDLEAIGENKVGSSSASSSGSEGHRMMPLSRLGKRRYTAYGSGLLASSIQVHNHAKLKATFPAHDNTISTLILLNDTSSFLTVSYDLSAVVWKRDGFEKQGALQQGRSSLSKASDEWKKFTLWTFQIDKERKICEDERVITESLQSVERFRTEKKNRPDDDQRSSMSNRRARGRERRRQQNAQQQNAQQQECEAEAATSTATTKDGAGTDDRDCVPAASAAQPELDAAMDGKYVLPDIAMDSAVDPCGLLAASSESVGLDEAPSAVLNISQKDFRREDPKRLSPFYTTQIEGISPRFLNKKGDVQSFVASSYLSTQMADLIPRSQRMKNTVVKSESGSQQRRKGVETAR